MTDRDKDVEILALRHQIGVLQRHLGPRTLTFTPVDRGLRARADNPLRDGGDYNTIINTDGADTTATSVTPSVLDDPEFQFMITLLVPGMVSAGYIDRSAGRVHVVRSRDGSWAEIASAGSGYQVSQGGKRRLWTEIETAADTWTSHGRPDRSRFGLTATGRTQIAWLDTPADVIAKWEG